MNLVWGDTGNMLKLVLGFVLLISDGKGPLAAVGPYVYSVDARSTRGTCLAIVKTFSGHRNYLSLNITGI